MHERFKQQEHILNCTYWTFAAEKISWDHCISKLFFVSRWSSGKKEGSRLFGRRSTNLGGALHIFKTKLGDNIWKSKSFFSWCSQLFCVYLCQFLKRPVWRKISIWKINFNLVIQKSKLKRNRQDEIIRISIISYN